MDEPPKVRLHHVVHVRNRRLPLRQVQEVGPLAMTVLLSYRRRVARSERWEKTCCLLFETHSWDHLCGFCASSAAPLPAEVPSKRLDWRAVAVFAAVAAQRTLA